MVKYEGGGSFFSYLYRVRNDHIATFLFRLVWFQFWAPHENSVSNVVLALENLLEWFSQFFLEPFVVATADEDDQQDEGNSTGDSRDDVGHAIIITVVDVAISEISTTPWGIIWRTIAILVAAAIRTGCNSTAHFEINIK